MHRSARAFIRLLVTLWTAFEYCVRYFLMSLAHRFSLTRAQRAHWLHNCCQTALRRLGVPITIIGEIPPRGLLASNHLSYLDIMVLSAICDCTFVAKTEVRYWLVFGWMATMSGTVYVDRQRPLATADVNDQLALTLREGLRVVMFPESTSTDGSHVLPFRSSLFGAATSEQQSITPVYLNYEAQGGIVGQDVCYWGDMTFFPHLLRMLGLLHLTATVTFGVTQTFADRKVAAKQMHHDVETLAAAIANGSASLS